MHHHHHHHDHRHITIMITTVIVNHACFDDAEKNLLDNDCHHKKGEECESCRF